MIYSTNITKWRKKLSPTIRCELQDNFFDVARAATECDEYFDWFDEASKNIAEAIKTAEIENEKGIILVKSNGKSLMFGTN